MSKQGIWFIDRHGMIRYLPITRRIPLRRRIIRAIRNTWRRLLAVLFILVALAACTPDSGAPTGPRLGPNWPHATCNQVSTCWPSPAGVTAP